MNRTKLKLWLAVLALSPALSWALPGDGIATTEHDFTLANNATYGADVGACTYCHTPHKAVSTLLLWNHTLSANSFTWDVTTTTAGTTFPTIAGATYKGPTAKCLSCHDGSVAVGDIAWFMAAPHTGAGAMNTTTIPAGDPHIIGSGGAMAGNHPVAMPYPAGNVANTYNGQTTGAGAVLTEWVASPAAPIRLFNDDGTGNISAGIVATKTGIECSSCHDPHNKAAVDDMFLRGKLVGAAVADGYLCVQCHIK